MQKDLFSEKSTVKEWGVFFDSATYLPKAGEWVMARLGDSYDCGKVGDDMKVEGGLAISEYDGFIIV